MEPTLTARERFLYDAQYYRHQPEHRGDLAVIRRGNYLTVKRIIAVSGDTIQGTNRQITVNGQVQTEPFIQHQFGLGVNPDLDTFGPVTVSAGKYFVMGDNRDVSLDSRISSFGSVDVKAIVGRPLYTYRLSGRHPSRELR